MNNNENMPQKCLIWNTDAIEIRNLSEKQAVFVNSPRAGGKYSISAKAKNMVKKLDDKKKACLTSWLVKQRWSGVKCPMIDDKTIRNEEYGKALSYSDRMDKLLEHIKRKADKKPGKPVRIITWRGRTEAAPYYQEALAASELTERDEFISLLHEMHGKGWLKDTISGEEDQFKPFLKGGSVYITAEGHKRLEGLKQTAQNSSKAFVAMWFDESTSQAWQQGIKPAVRDSGYEPFRVDEAEDVGRIDDRIIAEIRRSKFIVADLTHGAEGARGGVYYEAGFAHGLGKLVIFTCRKDLIEKVHFDIRQYNNILWEKPEDLRERLANRISALFGDGPAKIQ